MGRSGARSRLKLVLVLLVALLLAAGVGLFYLGYAGKPKSPQLSSSVRSGTIHVGDRDRSYVSYVPANVPPNSPLLFVFHGSRQDAEGMRVSTGYRFEQLADEKGFVVVYPNGYEGNWNDCRRAADYPARALHIDDEGMVRGLVAQFQASNAIDASRVFAAGYSNGGHMAYRLAVEMPTVVAAVAAIAANFPAPDNFDCQASGKPVPVAVVNGTKDPLNPYNGGIVSLFGWQPRGQVLSADGTAAYFANLDGLSEPAVTSTLPHNPASGDTRVTFKDYRTAGKPEVVLYTVENGGHVVPQPVYEAQRILGSTTKDLDAPAAIWDFFARQSPIRS